MEARVLVVVGVAAVALLAAVIWRRRSEPAHPPVDAAGLLTGPGIVIFTRKDCSNCEQALAIVGAQGVPVREVRLEQEPEVAERAGVEGVPLAVIIGAAGTQTAQLAGRLREGTVRRAVRRARR